MSTRTRRKELGATKTKEQRRKERWQTKVAAATTPAARFAVKQDFFRASVELMIHRHIRLVDGQRVSNPRAEAQGDALLDQAGDWMEQIALALNGGDYDQPS